MPPDTPTAEPERPTESAFAQVSAVMNPLAERYAGQPARVVRPAVRRAWQSAFRAELGEPALSWCVQAIQDRQPWSLVCRHRGAGSRKQHGPVGQLRRPAGLLSASLDLPPTALAPTTTHLLLRELLTVWGLGSQQVIEDVQLVATALVDDALDRARGDAPIRFDLSLADGLLRVTVTVESARSRKRWPAPRPARRRRRSSLTLLGALTGRWGRDTFPGGDRTWFELGLPGLAEPGSVPASAAGRGPAGTGVRRSPSARGTSPRAGSGSGLRGSG